jgi:hypothetical protein
VGRSGEWRFKCEQPVDKEVLKALDADFVVEIKTGASWNGQIGWFSPWPVIVSDRGVPLWGKDDGLDEAE